MYMFSFSLQTKKRIDKDSGYESIERGCALEQCYDSTWTRDGGFGEDSCCTGDLCNKEELHDSGAAGHYRQAVVLMVSMVFLLITM